MGKPRASGMLRRKGDRQRHRKPLASATMSFDGARIVTTSSAWFSPSGQIIRTGDVIACVWKFFPRPSRVSILSAQYPRKAAPLHETNPRRRAADWLSGDHRRNRCCLGNRVKRPPCHLRCVELEIGEALIIENVIGGGGATSSMFSTVCACHRMSAISPTASPHCRKAHKKWPKDPA